MIKNTLRILFLFIYKEDILKCHPSQINDTEASLPYHGDSSFMELWIREHSGVLYSFILRERNYFPRE